MCYFIPIPSETFHIAKYKNEFTFVVQICLFSSFAFRFSFVNYFFALSQLVFKRLLYFNFFAVLNNAIKVIA